MVNRLYEFSFQIGLYNIIKKITWAEFRTPFFGDSGIQVLTLYFGSLVFMQSVYGF